MGERAYIFLDIDGVLNSLRSCVGLGGYKPEHLDPVAIGLLNYLCDALTAEDLEPQVVISSTWRLKHKDVEWWRNLFHQHGAASVLVVGMTPDMGNRSVEVVSWLIANTPDARAAKHVIFDDDGGFRPEQPHVLTSRLAGLGLDDIDDAFSILTAGHLFDDTLRGLTKWKALRVVRRGRETDRRRGR